MCSGACPTTPTIQPLLSPQGAVLYAALHPVQRPLTTMYMTLTQLATYVNEYAPRLAAACPVPESCTCFMLEAQYLPVMLPGSLTAAAPSLPLVCKLAAGP